MFYDVTLIWRLEDLPKTQIKLLLAVSLLSVMSFLLSFISALLNNLIYPNISGNP